MYFVYILKNDKVAKHPYYIGFTGNLNIRINEHNSATNHGYTRNGIWHLVYAEAYINDSLAFDREKKLKQFGNVWYGVMRRIKPPSDRKPLRQHKRLYKHR